MRQLLQPKALLLLLLLLLLLKRGGQHQHQHQKRQSLQQQQGQRQRQQGRMRMLVVVMVMAVGVLGARPSASAARLARRHRRSSWRSCRWGLRGWLCALCAAVLGIDVCWKLLVELLWRAGV
jgi:hypothetical protein